MSTEKQYIPPDPQIFGDQPLLFNPRTDELITILEGSWQPASYTACGTCFSDLVEFRSLEVEEFCESCGYFVEQESTMSVCLNCFAVDGPILRIPFSSYVFGVKRDFGVK